jgi:proline racemase
MSYTLQFLNCNLGDLWNVGSSLWGIYFIWNTCGIGFLFFVLEGQRNGRKISPQSLGILVKAKNAMLIDLRDAKDFREGHISGSRNIPYSQITKHAEELKAADRRPLVFILGQVAGTALQQVAY